MQTHGRQRGWACGSRMTVGQQAQAGGAERKQWACVLGMCVRHARRTCAVRPDRTATQRSRHSGVRRAVQDQGWEDSGVTLRRTHGSFRMLASRLDMVSSGCGANALCRGRRSGRRGDEEAVAGG